MRYKIALGACVLTTALFMSKAHAACPIQDGSRTQKLDDGCQDAAQDGYLNPGLLKSYGKHRPGWNVAGVDYPVGVSTSAKLIDWQTLSSTPGIDFYDGAIRCDGPTAAHPTSSPVVLDGIDFTTHGGAYIYVPTAGCAGLTVRNSRFGTAHGQSGCSAWTYYAIQDQNIGTPLTLERNSFDMTNCPIGQAAVIFAPGNTKVTYNYFGHLTGQVLQAPTGEFDIDYRFNYIEDCCYTDTHMNFQEFGTSANARSDRVEFNTTYEYQLLPGRGEEFQFYGNTGGTLQSATLANNTIIALASKECSGPQQQCNVSFAIHGSAGSQPPTKVASQPVNRENFFDPGGMLGAYYPGSMNGWSNLGNTDMRTGARIVPPR